MFLSAEIPSPLNAQLTLTSRVSQISSWGKSWTASRPYGGETCPSDGGVGPRCTSSTASAEAQTLHLTFLNTGWYTPCYDKLGSLMNTWGTYMGYRFTLVSADLPDKIPSSGTFHIKIVVANKGYAKLHRGRPAMLYAFDSSNKLISGAAWNLKWVAHTRIHTH